MKNKEKLNAFPIWLKVALPVIALVLLLGGGWALKVQQLDHKAAVENLLSSIAKLKVKQLMEWRSQQMANALILMDRETLVRDIYNYMKSPEAGTKGEILRRLKPVKIRLHLADVSLLNTKGEMQLSMAGPIFNVGISQAFLDQVRSERTPVWTGLHTGSGHSEIYNSLVVPLFTGKDKTIQVGFLLLVNDARQYLYPLIQSWPIPSETAETLLVRKDGKDVLFLNELRHQKGTALKLRIRRTQMELPAAMAVAGKTGIVYGKDYRGVPVVAYVLPVPDTAGFMVAKIDQDEAFSAWKRQFRLILLLILGGLGLIGATALVVHQRTLKADFRARYQAEAAFRKIVQRHSVTLHAIGDAVISTDTDGRVELMNPVAEELTGWKEKEALGKELGQVFQIVSELTGEEVESPVTRVLREGIVVGLANHTLLIARDGREIPIADSGAPILDEQGSVTGVVLVFRDQTEERTTQLLTEKRLALITYGISHSLDELLRQALDQVESLVDSPIAFFHFVEADQKTLSLQQWSTRTLKEYCEAEGKGMHYGIDEAGVWADCVREKRPVVHNDYAALSDKKGLPEGHAELVRELVVPVMREGKAVAVLGVGNKATNYTDRDIEIVSFFADVTWETVHQKRLQQDRLVSETKYRALFEGINDAVFVHPVKAEGFGNFIEVNEVACKRLGYTREELLKLSAADISAPEDVKLRGNRDLRQQLLKDGWLVFEAVHMTKEGKAIPVEISSRAFELNGRPVEMSMARDISERKLAEQALRESEALFRGIYENANIGLYRTTPDGRILMANPALVGMMGYSSFDELSQLNLESNLFQTPETPRSRFKEILEQHDRVDGLESAWRRKDGTLLWIRENARVVRDEDGKILYYEGTVEDITERKQAEEKMRESEEKYRLIFNNVPLGIFHYDTEGVILSCNDKFVEIIGSSKEQLVGLNMLNLPDQQIVEAVRESINGNAWFYEGDYHSFTAEKVTPVRVFFTPVISEEGEIRGGAGIAEDITKRKQAEAERESLQEQLLQSQKIESIGRLAGGVAHDYNNMLGVILGRTEMVLAKMDKDDPNRGSMEAIMRAGKRSADLTRQLLAFARKQTIQPKVLDLNDTIENMLKMLRQIIGENIELDWQPGNGLWTVEMDPVQLDQILANLCVNARDAISGTGEVTIETENKVIDEAYCAVHSESIPGPYVMLAVSDDGCGMDEETRSHIFDPFFTTKGVGEGTGLGLSTVYGIVKQNNGFINVYSEPGEGTTFRIYIPMYEGETTEKTETVVSEIPHGTGQRILLVEDEAVLLDMARLMLEELGYQVQTASLPAEALSYLQENSRSIDLLITDVVMPGMSGKELAEEVRKLCDGVKVLFMSGYTANAIAHQGVLDKGVAFIQKPFSLRELAQIVNDVLNQL